jgi:small nuclear ribonucleoprotein (snRNP)-like protein
MTGYRSVSPYAHLDDFIGENVRVITNNSHYRGECEKIDRENNNVILKNVVIKNETGWVEVSDYMLVTGHAIESVYIEKSFPFDSNESLILSIENGAELPDSEPGLQGLDGIADNTEITDISELSNLHEIKLPEELK